MGRQSNYPLKNNPDGTETVTVAEGNSATKKIPLNKFPVSEAAQTALNGKASSSHSHPSTALTDFSADTPNQDDMLVNKAGEWKPLERSPVVQSFGEWLFQGVSVDEDPGSNNLKFNNATTPSVTEIYINNGNTSGAGLGVLMDLLKADDILYFQHSTDKTVSAVFKIVSVVDNGTYTTLNVTHEGGGSGGNFVAGKRFSFALGHSSAASAHTHLASEINMPVLGTPTYTTLADQSNIIRSTGVIDGGEILNNGDGTVKVLAGSGIIRATNDLLAELLSLDWAEAPSIALTDQIFNHIYLEYNGGTPQLVADPANRPDFQTNILLGGVYRDGNEIHLTPQIREDVLDTTKRLIRRFEDTQPFQHANGAILSESGTRNIRCTAGLFKIGLNDVETILQDTSGVSPDNNHTFEYFYKNAGNFITHEADIAAAEFTGAGLDDMTSGGTFIGSHTIRIHVEITATGASDTIKWSFKDNDGVTVVETTGVTIIAGPMMLTEGATATFAAVTGHTIGDSWDIDLTLSSQIDNTQYDNGSGLGVLGNGRYGVHWIYEDIHGHLSARFGAASYTLADAEDAPIPSSTPPEFEHHVRLIGKIIIRKGESTFTKIENNYGNAFQAAVVTSHDALADVQGGITNEHFHLSQAELTDVQAIEEVFTLTEKNSLGTMEDNAKDDQVASEVPFTPNGDIAAVNTQLAIQEVRDDADTKLGNKEDTANKGAANGYAPLDGSSQVPLANLPASVKDGSDFKGVWNATTNSPTLIDGTGTNGDWHRVSVAGTQNLGVGSEDYAIGDVVVYDGTKTTWDRIDGNDAVSLVNGKSGVVTLDTDDLSDAGKTNKFTTQTEIDKLTNIEPNAKDDQTGAEMKTALFAESNTNNFDDAAVLTLAQANPMFLTLQAGEILAIGDWCYRDVTDGKMKKVDANTESTVQGLIAICTEALAADATGKFQTKGIFVTTSLTANKEYFISETTGEIVDTEVVTVGAYTRSIGVALSATQIYIDVDHSYYRIAA